MIYASYREENNELIPVCVSLGEMQTPVWLQQRWEAGEYAIYVRKNGCGHCCAAMALNMHGVKIDPHEEYELCVKLWGHPKIDGHEKQGNFQSVDGIAKVIRHFGIAAESFGVPDRESAIQKEHPKRAWVGTCPFYHPFWDAYFVCPRCRAFVTVGIKARSRPTRGRRLFSLLRAPRC